MSAEVIPLRPPKREVWQCADCGCQLFYVFTTGGMECSFCRARFFCERQR